MSKFGPNLSLVPDFVYARRDGSDESASMQMLV